MFESLCRGVLPICHDVTRIPDQGAYLPALGWNIEQHLIRAASADQDSIEDYHEIRGSVCWNPSVEAHCINMVGPARAHSWNSSSKYPTIRGSEASNARTLINKVVWNLNLDFNTVRLQTITESIQRMGPQNSPLVALAQQGVEAVGHCSRTVSGEPSG
jgi:hypothetical protein